MTTTDAAEALAKKLTEDQLSTHVANLARMMGWRGYHTHDSRRSAAGFPDWVFARGGHIIFAELKTEKGQLTAAQEAWASDLWEAAILQFPKVRMCVWRPSDWYAGRIDEVLK